MDSPPPPLPPPARDRRAADNERRRGGRDREPRREPRFDEERLDYKRRRSPPSPPPPPPPSQYRGRDRRPSPPYKRSRRDDRRVGTHGGRSGSYSGDERSSGRRQEYGRGGSRDGLLSSRKEGLMTYKQFISELEDDVSPSEAERRYLEYKNAFISTQKKTFFEQNKQEDWLRDMYDPSRLGAVIQRRNETCRLAARDFVTDLESGSLDLSPIFSLQDQKDQDNSDEDHDGRPRKNGYGASKDQHSSQAPKAPSVSCEPRRIDKDIEQARALIRKLDTEKGIEQNILVSSDAEKSESEKPMNSIVIVRVANHVKGYEGVELLDVVLTYLWRVHYVDYYGSREYKAQPKGMRHVRAESKANEDILLSTEWEKRLDAIWHGRLQGNDPLAVMIAEEKMEPAIARAIEPLIRKIKDEKYGWKYGCGAKNCSKLFHGPEFVQKHLKLKHPELVTEATSKIYEDLYFENYMSDPEAPGSTPAMVSQKEVSRKPSSGRDMDRGGRGGRESVDRTNEQSPAHDYPSGGPLDSAGQFDGDKDRFERLGGGMRGPMGIPPVLMPVPGAGPLGPFVPAPPEVAMRLWREQGGGGPFPAGGYDDSFEAEGGNSRANRNRSGPMTGVGLIDTPPMILPLPNAHHDPRRIMRSYRDLDAPEDEIGVIDYRTL